MIQCNTKALQYVRFFGILYSTRRPDKMKKRMIATNTFEMQVPGNDRLTLEFEVQVYNTESKDPQDEDDTIDILSADIYLSVDGMKFDSIRLENEHISLTEVFKSEIEEFVIKNWWKLDFKELEKDEDDGE